MTSLEEAYATAIRSRRDRENLTQEELAEQFAVSTRTIQNWEAGVLPRAKHRRAILAWLNNGKEAA